MQPEPKYDDNTDTHQWMWQGPDVVMGSNIQ